jgi:tetraacyldisaccharide 4'-kinase
MLTRRKRLPKPVISVGNLTAGGTGKTPFTLWLAQALQERGKRVCVLSRGYKSGEEALLYERAGIQVATGRDRYAAAQGRDADLFLLDDGMQHWALARDVEIVVMDGLDPTGGGLIPLGRARESWAARQRADVLVSTRRPMGSTYFARVIADVREGEAGAFCGLGNPASFHRSLRAAGVKLKFFEVFPDHHVYSEDEIDDLLARGCELLTTEKDWLNLHPSQQPRVSSVPIRLEITDAEALLDRVEALLRARAGAS